MARRASESGSIDSAALGLVSFARAQWLCAQSDRSGRILASIFLEERETERAGPAGTGGLGYVESAWCGPARPLGDHGKDWGGAGRGDGEREGVRPELPGWAGALVPSLHP